jgi:acetylornithine deacetylase
MVSQRESLGVSYASDAGPLQALGLECVVFGPGSIEVAHKANESLPKAEFVRARSLLDRIIERFCMV